MNKLSTNLNGILKDNEGNPKPNVAEAKITLVSPLGTQTLDLHGIEAVLLTCSATSPCGTLRSVRLLFGRFSVSPDLRAGPRGAMRYFGTGLVKENKKQKKNLTESDKDSSGECGVT